MGRRGQGQDDRSRQHSSCPSQDQGGPDHRVPQGGEDDPDDRLEGQEKIVEALVEGVEGVRADLLRSASEGLAGQCPSQAMDSM